MAKQTKQQQEQHMLASFLLAICLIIIMSTNLVMTDPESSASSSPGHHRRRHAVAWNQRRRRRHKKRSTKKQPPKGGWVVTTTSTPIRLPLVDVPTLPPDPLVSVVLAEEEDDSLELQEEDTLEPQQGVVGAEGSKQEEIQGAVVVSTNKEKVAEASSKIIRRHHRMVRGNTPFEQHALELQRLQHLKQREEGRQAALRQHAVQEATLKVQQRLDKDAPKPEQEHTSLWQALQIQVIQEFRSYQAFMDKQWATCLEEFQHDDDLSLLYQQEEDEDDDEDDIYQDWNVLDGDSTQSSEQEPVSRTVKSTTSKKSKKSKKKKKGTSRRKAALPQE